MFKLMVSLARTLLLPHKHTLEQLDATLDVATETPGHQPNNNQKAASLQDCRSTGPIHVMQQTHYHCAPRRCKTRSASTARACSTCCSTRSSPQVHANEKMSASLALLIRSTQYFRSCESPVSSLTVKYIKISGIQIAIEAINTPDVDYIPTNVSLNGTNMSFVSDR